MAEQAQEKVMAEDNTPKKEMFMNRPYSQEERIRKMKKNLKGSLKSKKVKLRLSKRKMRMKQNRLLLKRKLLKSDMEI